MSDVLVGVTAMVVPLVCVLVLGCAFVLPARLIAFGNPSRIKITRAARWGVLAVLAGAMLAELVGRFGFGYSGASASTLGVGLTAGAVTALVLPVVRGRDRRGGQRGWRSAILPVAVGTALAWGVLAVVTAEVRALNTFGTRTDDGQFTLQIPSGGAYTASNMPDVADCVLAAVLIAILAVATTYFLAHCSGPYAENQRYYAGLLSASATATIVGELASDAHRIAAEGYSMRFTAADGFPGIDGLNDSLDNLSTFSRFGGIGLLLAVVVSWSRGADGVIAPRPAVRGAGVERD